MQLLSGPAGSGKTTLVLDRLREALRRNDARVRLLVPTATMARHLQNRLAREGHVFRPRLIQTLSRFIETWTADVPQVSEPRLYLMVEEAARRTGRPEFARVSHLAGFCAALARTLEEFSAAGCDSRRLQHSLPASPLSEAFLAVYEEVDRDLAHRGLALRATRLERAAARIAAGGLDGIHTVWLDGFHALPDPELAVIEAMARHSDVTVTLPSGAATRATHERLLAMGCAEQHCETRRAHPAIEVFEAPRIEREADEIARRVIEQAAAGKPFREMGIIVRNTKLYEPILRTTLERFRIPARFYMDAPLAAHGVTRYLTGAVDAMLGGWDWAEVLAVLRLDPTIGASSAMDRFDFAVRQRIPGRGLDALKMLAGEGPMAESLARLQSLEAWQAQRLFLPAQPREPFSREFVEIWRSQAAALEGFAEAIEEAAASFADAPTASPAEFWRVAKAVLRLLPLRPRDERRNVVHVLTAPEARQWELPVVFVCGLVEKQFPHYSPQDPFFPDVARHELNRAGIRLRTAADAEMEEEALFDSAISRATSLLVVSYPKYDERGEQNLPSVFLEKLPSERQQAEFVQPEAARERTAPSGRGIMTPALHELLAARHAKMRVTALESFAQCPFQFFARYTLALEEPPPRPEQRLDARVQGNIVHRVIAEWLRTRQPMEPLFAGIFDNICRDQCIVRGYRTESLREQMLEDLLRFAAHKDWPAGAGTLTEEPFEFNLAGVVTLRGRIDRLEKSAAGEGRVVDYKYSKKNYAREESRLQGPLYLLAVESAFGLRPAGMYYCGLRGEVRYVEQNISRERIEAVTQAAVHAAGRIREGETTANPADLDQCRYCTYRDVCRYVAAGQVAVGEGA
jgi:ATP-dependent helicase/DNAse subunit B